MGCDIHCYSEVKLYRYDDEKHEHGIWISDDKWTVNPDFYKHPEERERQMYVELDDRVIWQRWYGLFAVLAGVRNNWNITPIAEPKGLPCDVCEQVKAEAEWCGSDGHSHSWFTLRELEEYPLSNWVHENVLTLEREWERILNVLREKCKNHRVSTSDVRIVFFFDN